MDSYSNKINFLKNNIDEIKDDIEKMKKVIKIIFTRIFYSKSNEIKI